MTLRASESRGEGLLGTAPRSSQRGGKLLDEDVQEYVRFHLETVGCAHCLANKADLQASFKEPAPKAQERRRRYFQSSAGYLKAGRDAKG